jgi:hypothetical protein
VDPHRRYPEEYSDSSDGRWYPGERGYPDQEWDRRGGDPRYEEAPGYADQEHYRVPEPRGATTSGYEGRYGDADPLGMRQPVGPRSGEPLPPLPGTPGGLGGPPLHSGPPPALPPVSGAPPIGGVTGELPAARLAAGPRPSVYRSRRPALIAVLAVMVVMFEIPALRLFFVSFGKVLASGLVASSFLIMGLPMFALGLYALLTGAAVAPDQPTVRAWLRAPLAYLPVGLVLLVAAALAAT